MYTKFVVIAGGYHAYMMFIAFIGNNVFVGVIVANCNCCGNNLIFIINKVFYWWIIYRENKKLYTMTLVIGQTNGV